MEHWTLGTSDIGVSRLIFGTMTFGSQVDLPEARSMVEACVEAGVTMFDTANSYNAGLSEEMLGTVVKERRGEILIATKVSNPMGPDPDDAGLSRGAIFKAIDASLGRLQTDYVDLYYLHKPDRNTPVEESLEAMQDLIDAGKVRSVGTSNYAAWQLVDMEYLAEQRGWQVPAISQQMYNLLARRLDDEYGAFAAAHHHIKNVVYNPLAGGLLTGKHRYGAAAAPNSRFSMETYRERYWNDAQFDAIDRLKRIAGDAGLTLLELSFHWLLSRPLVDAVLIGASNLEQLRSNLAACAQTHVDEEVALACDEVWQTLRGAAPKYNR